MKKRVKHHLKSMALGAVALAAIVAVDGGQMNKASADVRVQARLQLPNLSVEYRNTPDYGRVVQRTYPPFVYRITAEDRAIARRLARRSGHRTIVLLDLRSRGLSWEQIGRRLDIPRGLVRVAVYGPRVSGHANASCSIHDHGKVHGKGHGHGHGHGHGRGHRR